jgi:hypothetical protein
MDGMPGSASPLAQPIGGWLGSRNPEHVNMNIDLPEFVLLALVISVVVFLGIHVRRGRKR